MNYWKTLFVLIFTSFFVSACTGTETTKDVDQVQTPASLPLVIACEGLPAITEQLATGIGKAQDDPENAAMHLDVSRNALTLLSQIKSTDNDFNEASAQVIIDLNEFIDRLQAAIESGGGLNDSSVTPSRDTARASGEVLDAVCK